MKNQNPATPAEAEELAKKAVGDYLTACRINAPDPSMVGNYLMKLVSVAGIMMAYAEGSDAASDRLMGTAGFVSAHAPKKPSAFRTVQ